MAVILLPKTFQQNPFFQGLGHYCGIETLSGKEPTVAELTSILATLPREKVLAWICSLSAFVSMQEAKDVKAQFRLSSELLPPDLHEAYRQFVRREAKAVGGPSGLFHLQQLWFLLQMAVMVCKDDVPDVSDKEFKERASVACLMSNTIMQKIDASIRSASATDENLDEWCVGVFLPLKEVYFDDEVLHRAHVLWFECAGSQRVRDKAAELKIDPDIARVFESAYKIPFKEFFLLLVLLRVHYQAERDKNRRKPVLMDSQLYLEKAFDREFLDSALPLITQTTDKLALRLLATRQSWSIDISPLRDYPLIQVFDNRYCCPDLFLLQRTVTDRVHHLLAEAYDTPKFRSLFGTIFEEYLNRVVAEFAPPTSSKLISSAFFDPKFEGTPNEAGDCILQYGDIAVVMEWKSNRLTSHQKYGSSAEELVQGIKDFLAKSVEKNGKETQKKGARQLSAVLKTIFEGKKVVATNQKPTDLSKCRALYPMIVTMEESVAINCVRRIIQKEFDGFLERDEVDKSRIKPLMILSVRDFEDLKVAAQHLSVQDILEKFVTYIANHDAIPSGGFHDFLFTLNITALDDNLRPVYEHYQEEIIKRVEARKPVEQTTTEPEPSPIIIPDADTVEKYRQS